MNTVHMAFNFILEIKTKFQCYSLHSCELKQRSQLSACENFTVSIKDHKVTSDVSTLSFVHALLHVWSMWRAHKYIFIQLPLKVL